jgi:hypothetical protein
MSKQSIFITLVIVAMIPFALALTNFAVVAFLGYGFLPEGSTTTNAVCGFVCWLSFAITTWVVYKTIESLTESY